MRLVCLLALVAIAPGKGDDTIPQPLLVNLETSGNGSAPTSPAMLDNTHSVIKKKGHNGTEICNKTEPISCSVLTQAKFYQIYINESNPCRFSCYYDPSQMSPLRLEVHQHYEHPSKSPTYVSVQQDFYISSWTLPVIFPVEGEDQKFTSMETLLCPPANEKKETVDFLISARGPEPKMLQIALHNVSFILQKRVNVSVQVSPVSLWYKRYQWAASEESVLITAQSDPKGSEVCGLLVLQNAKCPVSSEVSGLTDRGRYQTFTKQAGMVARRSEFPEGVQTIVISLPDNDACILNPSETHNKTSGRQKTVWLEVYDHATIDETWYIFLLTAIVIAMIVAAATVVIINVNKRTLSEYVSQAKADRHQRSGSRERLICQVECGAGVAMRHGENLEGNIPQGVGNNLFQNDQGQEGEGLAQRATGEAARATEGRRLLALEGTEPVQDANPRDGDLPVVPAASTPHVFPSTTYAPQGELLNLDRSFNPVYVWWWKSVAVHEAKTSEAQVSEVGIQNSLVIMAIFAALPLSELLRSYLRMVLHHGQEDLCFWNSRCLTTFAGLPDFARVFTNIGYILLGIAFVFIVWKHRILTHDILQGTTEKTSVGVSHHYGLFTSLGYGLIMQGVMSALYHTCPNSITIKFDMMFMYVMMVVAVVAIWGLRHGDVTHHVYPTVIAVGLMLMVAEARVWLSAGVFWGIFSTIYAITLISNAVFMSAYGIWSFSPSKLWHAWSGWKEINTKVKDIFREQGQDTTSRPIQVIRLMVGVGSNVGLMLFGILNDPNFYYFILMVCLINMSLYFANYVIAKRLAFEEKGTALGWTSLGLSCILWIIALVFFFRKRTDSESSPADSRARNSPCDFLSVYDDHDIWHLTSSFALFFFFVALLTVDDDLFAKDAKEIEVA